jgi:hypothetical protein
MNRDAILAELLELEGMLLDSRLNDEDRHALHGAAQALRHVLDAATWQPASQTFYRVGDRRGGLGAGELSVTTTSVGLEAPRRSRAAVYLSVGNPVGNTELAPKTS